VGGLSSAGFNFTVIPSAPLNTSRYQHSATLLNNGMILIAGGANCPTTGSCTYLNSGEIYNPATATSTNTGNLATPRAAPAVLLTNGNVLIAGGSTCDNYGNCFSLNSAEIYNPASGTFSSAGNMQTERDGQTLTLLADGNVLIAGGESCIPGGGGGGSSSKNLGKPLSGGQHLTYASFTPVTNSVTCTALASAEIYDPQTGTFSLTGSLNTARYNAAAIQLANGQILVAGGSNEYYALNVAELYNPSTGSFTTTASGLETARSSPDVTLLNSSLVLVSGGSTCQTPTCPTNTAELYNPTANGFQYTSGNMNVSRVNHAAVLLTNGQVLLAGGTNQCYGPSSCISDATTEVYDPTAGTFSLTQGLAAARSGHTGTLMPDGSVLLAGGIAGGTTLSSVEFYQPASLTPSGLVSIAVAPANSSTYVAGIQQFVATGTFSDGSTSTLQSAVWSSSNPTAAVINNAASDSGFAFGVGLGSATITATVGAMSGSATLAVQPPVQSTGFTTTTGQMGTSLYAQTATRLTTGQVLIAGGMSPSGVVNNAQLYTSASQTFAAVNPMNVARWLHTATLLNDGTVLIAGGSELANEETLDSAEIYNPTAGTFTLLSNTLNTARVGHTATLLNNGQVLIVGGYDPETGLIADAELYDPPSQTFIDLGDTNAPRYRHTSTVLQNGQVLIAGGETDPVPTGAYNTAELFDPVRQAFTLVSVPMTTPRQGHAAVLLNNGQVLISGGNDPGTGSLNTAELYDPNSDIFIAVAGVMTTPRISHVMTLLNGGQVLIVGGASGASGTALASTETYNPASQLFTAAGSMASVREYQTDTLLNDGTVFIAGGTDGTNIFNTAESYMATQLNGLTSVAVTPASSSIGTGGQQAFTAVGTFSNGNTENLASVLWSSSNTSVATISNDATDPGVASSSTQGTTTVTASVLGVSGLATLTITAPTLVSIQLSPQSPTIPVGATQQFTATGVYTDGSTQDLTSSAAWSISASVVATINSSGLVAGLFQGVATLQVSSGSVNATTNVNVASAALVSIAIGPASATIAVGTSQQYQATGTYSDGSTQNVTGFVAWSSATTTVATINSTGLVLSISQGSTTVTANFEAISASVPLTIGSPSLISLSITPNLASLSIGGTQQLSAIGTYSDGSTQNLTTSSSWISSNGGVLAVSNSGLATAGAVGEVTITATSVSISGTTLLFVTSGTTQGNLSTSRYQHNATALDSGQILVVGGINCPSSAPCTYLNSAELYNPNTGSFASTGAMATARSAPSVLLNSGKVLTAGGYTCDSSGNCSSLSSAEIYDPVAGTFSSAGTMTVARSGQTMTPLPNGTVLIAGGENCASASSCSVLSSAELYDPLAGTFTATTNNMNSARFGASAVLLNEGMVLIVGGSDGTNVLAGTEAYISTGFIAGSGGPSLNVARMNATITLLNKGGVLVAGGSTCLAGCPTNASEFLPVNSNTLLLSQGPSGLIPQIGAGFAVVSGGMNVPRFSHTATLTTNGTVVIAGGYSSCGSSCSEEASTEVFDPVAGTFSVAQSVSTPLAGHTATLDGNGNVLLIGGVNAGVTLATDQWYQPTSLTPVGLVSIAISPANSSVALGQSNQFVATGTFNDGSTQTLESVIWNSSNPSVATVSNSSASVGVVTGQTGGATTLTANAGGIVGTTSANVETLVSLAITPANPTVVPVYVPQQLIATATFSDGSTQNVTASATWTCSNNSILLLGPISEFNGYIAGTAVGTATVTATLGSTQANTLVTSTTNPQPIVPSIATVSPTSGQAGTLVTITGTGFGSAQGNGSVLLGSAVGTIVSWSDTQIIATVALISQSGFVQVVQSDGNSSNTVPFTVNTATILNVSPTSGVAGTQVTVTGSGFGTTQGNGSAWLGTTPAAVVSWSDTLIVATVSPIARTGNAFVQQNGLSTNTVPFNVNTATITSASPANGAPGTEITITGSSFGATQGSGLVWLGTAIAVVQSWSNTQIVATVASGATSGSAQVLQNGVMSNAVPFSVNALQITSVSPNSGAPGIVVTINGNGFGSSQANGIVELGSTSGEVIGWSNTQILTAVASNSVSGVARVEQNGVWSNAVTFTVPSSGQSVMLVPNLFNLVVGQIQPVQAFNSSGESVTGLTWTSSNPHVISLSTDDPPILTALTTGHATITAGDASADVTVYPGGSTLPLGTVLWSNPGDGSGVKSIVPAVPSASGVADVFAMNGDCKLQAMKSDGTVAWSANIGQGPAGCNEFLPDFQGGVEVIGVSNYVDGAGVTLVQAQLQKLEGATGSADPAYLAQPFSAPASLNTAWLGSRDFWPDQPESAFPATVVHTNGTIFTALGVNAGNCNDSGIPEANEVVCSPVPGRGPHVAAINPLTGQATPLSLSGNAFPIDSYPAIISGGFGDWIIAGDGYAYLPYSYEGWTAWQPFQTWVTTNPTTGQGELVPACGVWGSNVGGVNAGGIAAATFTGTVYLAVLRIDTSGNATSIPLGNWGVSGNCNLPQGSGAVATPMNVTLITNADHGAVVTWQVLSSYYNGQNGPITTTNYIASLSGMSVVSQNTTPSLLKPVLQAQDGTFFGTSDQGMVRFDQNGKIKWTVGDSPQIATADNGVVGVSGITYDSNGNAIGAAGNANPNTTSMIAGARANGAAQAADISGPMGASQSADASGSIGNSFSAAQSWVSNVYQVLTGNVAQLSVPPVPVATPPNWSLAGANQSGNSTSPRCHDDRDDLIYQYQAYNVSDSYFPKPYPLFRPNCFEETNTAHSANFSFAQLNTTSGADYALIKNPLVVPASSGYGLDAWVADFGASRIINSAYRTPSHNAAIGGAQASRHMLGDAVDLQNQMCQNGNQCSEAGIQQWVEMVTAAGGVEKSDNIVNVNSTGAKASFIEPRSGPCALNCTHADWRYKDRNKYAH
jgi:N-acetylneuraminic acid mutarotase